jgi:alpha-1,6-mannosyltransferase
MIEKSPAIQESGVVPSPYPRLAFFLSAFALLGLYVDLGRRIDLIAPVWVYLFLYAAAFVYYVYAAWRLLPSVKSWKYATHFIFLLGILFRLAVVFAPPSLSTDMYRYVWDGRLILHGHNPYHYAPNASELRPLRDMAIWIPMEYRAYQDIYMTTSQIFFGIGGLLFHNSLTGFKLMYSALDIGVMALIWRLLVDLRRSPTLLIWYAWSPLPITEISLTGHQDVAGVALLLLAFLLVRHPRTEAWGAAALAASILTKGFVLLLLPLFIRTFGRRFALATAISFLILGLPMWIRLPDFLHGMQQYLSLVNVNSGIFHGLNVLLSLVTPWHYQIAGKLSDLAILVAAAWSARRPAESFSDLLRKSFIVLALTLLLIPTLFPWYLLWVLPFMCLLGRRPSTAFVLLTGLVVLLYTFYIWGDTLWWVPIMEYVPFYAVLWCEWRYWRQGQQADDQTGETSRDDRALPLAANAFTLLGAGEPR